MGDATRAANKEKSIDIVGALFFSFQLILLHRRAVYLAALIRADAVPPHVCILCIAACKVKRHFHFVLKALAYYVAPPRTLAQEERALHVC